MFKVNPDATQRFLGSIRFCPPELLGLSQPKDEMKMDMWQAGVTLFMMLTKEYPFDLQNIPNCLAQMRDNKPNLEGKIES